MDEKRYIEETRPAPRCRIVLSKDRGEWICRAYGCGAGGKVFGGPCMYDVEKEEAVSHPNPTDGKGGRKTIGLDDGIACCAATTMFDGRSFRCTRAPGHDKNYDPIPIPEHANGDVRWFDNPPGEDLRIAPEVFDPVNRPKHYATLTPEPITVIEGWGLGFCLGNAVKYISRAGKKDVSKTVEDLEKSIWYINRRIKQLRNGESK